MHSSSRERRYQSSVAYSNCSAPRTLETGDRLNSSVRCSNCWETERLVLTLPFFVSCSSSVSAQVSEWSWLPHLMLHRLKNWPNWLTRSPKLPPPLLQLATQPQISLKKLSNSLKMSLVCTSWLSLVARNGPLLLIDPLTLSRRFVLVPQSFW